MKQFSTIFKFELSGYFKNKIFIGFTAALIVVMAVVLFMPRFRSETAPDMNEIGTSYASKIIFAESTETDAKKIAEYVGMQLPDSEITVTDESEEQLVEDIQNEKYEMAVVFKSPLSYEYIVKTAGITDITSYIMDEALLTQYRLNRLGSLGISPEDSDEILNSQVTSEIKVIGNDQSQSFFYTYILMFLLYFAVMLYGQFVAQSVALEKSSRAMELLITSAKPVNLMFGKILGAGAAGLIQLVLLLGGAFTFYSVNKSFWQDNELINSIFGMPAKMMIFTVVFFVLGFLLYSFMYGAAASLASKLEDVNTLSMPITFMMIISFFITIFSMVGNVESPLMKIASFIPFTSPMAMFTRIAMGNVSAVEIAISIVILIASTFAMGYIAAAIYKIGVLMYGKPPKLNELVRALKNNKR